MIFWIALLPVSLFSMAAGETSTYKWQLCALGLSKPQITRTTACHVLSPFSRCGNHVTTTSTTAVTCNPTDRHALWFPFALIPNDDDNCDAVPGYRVWIFVVACSPGGEHYLVSTCRCCALLDDVCGYISRPRSSPEHFCVDANETFASFCCLMMRAGNDEDRTIVAPKCEDRDWLKLDTLKQEHVSVHC